MNTVKFKGTECHVAGNLPVVGSKAPFFELTTAALSEVGNEAYKGKKVILNIFPSLDTSVCATSVRKFNVEAAKLDDTAVLCISLDLPFAMGRFCETEGIKNVVALSAFRNHDFGENYGVLLADGPLKGLLTRAVIVLDKEGKVAYEQLVPEITEEPDYEKAIEAIKKI